MDGPPAELPGNGVRHASIDAAIHNEVPSARALFPYLPPYWVEHIQNTMFKGPTEFYYPPTAPITARPGSRPARRERELFAAGRPAASVPTVVPAASDLEMVRQQVLDAERLEIAVLCSPYPVDGLHNPDAAIALTRAFNDWQIAEWLDKEPRLRASIVIPIQLPAQAAEEIDRVAHHPGFVQVALPVRTERPLGSRLYHPVWDAIARHHLVAAIQFGGVPGNPPTPSGWPSYFYEEYVGAALTFASQLTSIVSEGVFDQFPTLRVLLVESGFTWLPAHMWRFDKEWRNLRRLVPWVKRPPSEYIREHVRLTVQPLDAPAEPRPLLEVVDQLGSDDMLLYASHYPRVHAADPESTLIQYLPEQFARKVRGDNARRLYQWSR
jgi:predicted TIM-barrel fold metal-dependent hydrolase